jgi:hypothetical protein
VNGQYLKVSQKWLIDHQTLINIFNEHSLIDLITKYPTMINSRDISTKIAVDITLDATHLCPVNTIACLCSEQEAPAEIEINSLISSNFNNHVNVLLF